MSTATPFELWDVTSGNLIQVFPSEHDALMLVRQAVAEHGRDYIASWELVQVSDAEDDETIALGHALADRAAMRSHA